MKRLAGALSLLLAACTDEGEKTCLKLRGEYEQLVVARTKPSAPAFDALLKDLGAIPKDSKGRACAEGLITAIRGVRSAQLAAPLARAPQVEDPANPCAPLAQQLGRADAGERPAILKALADCRHLHLDEDHPGEKASGESP